MHLKLRALKLRSWARADITHQNFTTGALIDKKFKLYKDELHVPQLTTRESLDPHVGCFTHLYTPVNRYCKVLSMLSALSPVQVYCKVLCIVSPVQVFQVGQVAALLHTQYRVTHEQRTVRVYSQLPSEVAIFHAV